MPKKVFGEKLGRDLKETLAFFGKVYGFTCSCDDEGHLVIMANLVISDEALFGREHEVKPGEERVQIGVQGDMFK